MKLNQYILAVLASTAFSTTALAQSKLTLPDKTSAKTKTAYFTRDTIKVGYQPEVRQVSVLTNAAYTIGTPTVDWLTSWQRAADVIQIATTYNVSVNGRQGYLPITFADGTTQNLLVYQSANTSAESVDITDFKHTITSATASSYQSGEGIENSYDGNTGTIYHSPWNGTTFPITLTYTLSGAPHVDYLNYVPRQTGYNGEFGEVEVLYSTAAAPATFISLGTTNLGFSKNASQIPLGQNGVDNVHSVRLVVKSGYNNFASAAEVEFYRTNNAIKNLLASLFEDKLCTTLKAGVTTADIAAIPNAFVQQLVQTILQGGYSTEFRVGEFEAYKTLATLRSELKLSGYNPYENPTGIYFEANKPIVIFVEGIDTNYPVSLIVKNFGKAGASEAQSESSFPLRNGLNVITPRHRGNGYISYFTDSYASAPKVKAHFALANENGYFDLQRGHDNAKWQTLLANAKSDILDIRSKRYQGAYPVARLRTTCPTQGVELLTNSDSTVWYQWEVLGLHRYNRAPKNRMFARVVWNGFMFADGVGAGVHDNHAASWINPDLSRFEIWGFAHELGHVNQVRPDFNGNGLTEVTNNIYSAYVQLRLSPTKYYRLEKETTGINDFSGVRGGRMQSYFEECLRKGSTWRFVEGPDNFKAKPDTIIVGNQDYEGNRLMRDTTVLQRGYDVFVMLAPLWQLQLYGHVAGFAPDLYGKTFEGLRNTTVAGNGTGGKFQMRFIKMVCDSTQLNFIPFFEKAGMLSPVNARVPDYTPAWIKISQAMIDEVKAYVASKNYPTPEGEINYITANNWEIYAGRKALVPGTLNAGCSVLGSGRIRVEHSAWQNAVAFETYDENDNLLRITMQGLNSPEGRTTYTEVLFPNTTTERAAYIKAVGWDGTRVVCYRK